MSTAFSERLGEKGIYEPATTQLLAMGPSGLSEATYGVDFVPSAHDWTGNVSYLAPSTGSSYKTTLIGEVRPDTDGTLLSARGGHFMSRAEEVRKITDDVKIKDVLVLGCPSGAPEKLRMLYNNQLETLNQVREADILKERHLRQNPVVKEWLRQSAADPNEPWEFIAVHLPLKYTTFPRTDPVPTKRRISKHTTGNDDEIRIDLTSKPIKIPCGNDIYVGALYEPNLLPDYGGTLFDHTLSKLRQHDIRDTDQELIPPWEMYEKLKPGTLVLVEATLHCFKHNDRQISKKIYHINGHSVRILASSSSPVEKRKVYTGSVGLAPTSSRSAASDAFAGFSVPTPPKKKQKAS